ncbi:hypothetical protein ACMYYO_11665 [Dermacoccaceae bacterium W4C1]
MLNRTLAAAGTACLLAVSAAPTALATGPDPEKVSPTTAAGDGPDLKPGIYRADLPGDETERFLKVTRAAGEAVSVNLFLPSAGLEDSETLRVELQTADGTSCGSDSGSASSYGDPWVSVTAQFDPSGTGSSQQDCASATEFQVAITRSDAEKTATAEVTVQRRPQVSGNAGAAAATDVAAVSVPARSGSQVTGGSTPGTATPLTAGQGHRIALDTRTGTQFFRVHLGWGQRLATSLQAPPNGDSYRPPEDLRVGLGLLGPTRESASAVGTGTVTVYADSTFTPSPASAATAPVRLNNATSTSSGVAGADRAGWYVIAIGVNSSSDEDLPQTTVPALLTTQVVGEAQSGPTFTANGQTLGAPAPGNLSGAGARTDGGGLSTWVKLGGSVLIVALAAAALAWALRSRRS